MLDDVDDWTMVFMYLMLNNLSIHDFLIILTNAAPDIFVFNHADQFPFPQEDFLHMRLFAGRTDPDDFFVSLA